MELFKSMFCYRSDLKYISKRHKSCPIDFFALDINISLHSDTNILKKKILVIFFIKNNSEI